MDKCGLAQPRHLAVDRRRSRERLARFAVLLVGVAACLALLEQFTGDCSFTLPDGSQEVVLAGPDPLTLELIGAPTVQGMAALVVAVQSGEDAATSAEAADAIDLAAEAVTSLQLQLTK